MFNIETFVKNRLDRVLANYMALTILTALAIHKKDFHAVKSAHRMMVEIFDNAKELIKTTCSKEIAIMVDRNELSDLPKLLVSYQILETYRKSVSSAFFTDPFDDKKNILLNKMGLDFDESSELPYLYIAQILNKMGNYAEAINLIPFLGTISSSAPTQLFIKNLFTNAKRYDKAIDAYLRLLQMWQKNTNLKLELNKICNKVLLDNGN